MTRQNGSKDPALSLRDQDGAPTAVETRHLLTFHRFEDLYEYCYHVASVVGLVCIKIFGYRDVRAEKLAEQTGVAFQLTNILRDVKEDAQMGRVYLPEEDLHSFGITPEDVAASPSRERLHPVLNDKRILYRVAGIVPGMQDLAGDRHSGLLITLDKPGERFPVSLSGKPNQLIIGLNQCASIHILIAIPVAYGLVGKEENATKSFQKCYKPSERLFLHYLV